jgi:hypothetical protein
MSLMPCTSATNYKSIRTSATIVYSNHDPVTPASIKIAVFDADLEAVEI